jgi:hypothetical protein
MYTSLTVAKPQSMVLMKNSANAVAPRALCWVASSGMTGGFSPGLVFGPVLGTFAGTLGCGGAGGPTGLDVDGGAEVVGGGTDTVGCGEVGGSDAGAVPPDEVQAAQASITNAANVQIRPTSE